MRSEMTDPIEPRSTAGQVLKGFGFVCLLNISLFIIGLVLLSRNWGDVGGPWISFASLAGLAGMLLTGLIGLVQLIYVVPLAFSKDSSLELRSLSF
jgi:hypothetical protein